MAVGGLGQWIYFTFHHWRKKRGVLMENPHLGKTHSEWTLVRARVQCCSVINVSCPFIEIISRLVSWILASKVKGPWGYI